MTVSTNVSAAVRLPMSVRVTVIVAVPARPVTGVPVTVRLAPLPPKTMLEAGTRVVSQLLPVGVTVASSSVMKASAPALKPEDTVWSVISEMAGAALGGDHQFKVATGDLQLAAEAAGERAGQVGGIKRVARVDAAAVDELVGGASCDFQAAEVGENEMKPRSTRKKFCCD